MSDAADCRRIIAEGRAAAVGAPNPYNANLEGGSMVRAVLWRCGYRQMTEEMMRRSPARQAYLRARGELPPSPCTVSRSEVIAG
jgi:hypothetical protein